MIKYELDSSCYTFRIPDMNPLADFQGPSCKKLRLHSHDGQKRKALVKRRKRNKNPKTNRRK